jgi:mannose-6-phosphate isomerase-like protein (cupin superfamily)
VISKSRGFRSAGVIVVVAPPLMMFAESQPKPHPKLVALQKSENGILPILTGPPETVTMKSGYVVLESGRSVGRHSTEQHEEMLVVLEGQGEMRFHDGSTIPIKGNTALYCPPQTEHDVRNSGTGVLRYVYVVADTR